MPEPEGAKAPEPAAEAEESPDILAVITPVCDLIPGRDKKKPEAVKASAVLMLGGRLSELGRGKKPSNHFVMLDPSGQREEGKALPYQIRWDDKWPHSRPIGAFDGTAILNSDYVRAGRLREMYAAELAGMMTGQLSRVGLPVTPPFSHSLEVRILYRANGINSLNLQDTEGMAWEMFPERDKEKRNIILTDELVWNIRAQAEGTIQDSENAARKLLTDHTHLWPLTSPFKINLTGTTEVKGKAIQIERLEELPKKLIISSAEAHVLIQLAGALHEIT